MNRLKSAALSAAMLSVVLSQPVNAQSANVNWGPWQFSWEVANGSGIGIRNVRFDGRQVLYKGSLPVIRVKYDRDGGNGGCGPYADRINWESLISDNSCHNGQKICQRSFSMFGKEWLEISGRAKIGSYDIVQAWFLASDGEIQPRLFSRGLQCQINHVHHPYWTLDFDIDGSPNDEMFVHSPVIGNLGYGPGWFRYTNEYDSRRNVSEPPTYFVREFGSSHGVFVAPSSTDGAADSFSSLTAGIRRYHAGENDEWQFGASGELQYNNAESVDRQDDVLWYIGHLSHRASEGPNQYHAVGPVLRVTR